MKLRDRIGLNNRPGRAGARRRPRSRPTAGSRPSPAYQDLKLRIHRELLDRVDLTNLRASEMDQATSELKSAVAMLIEEQAVPLSARDRERLAEEILHESTASGRSSRSCATGHLRHPGHTSRQVYIERLGKLEPTPVIFRDDQHLLQIIDRIVSRVAGASTRARPWWTRACDGSRVNAIIPPLALDGRCSPFRRFGRPRSRRGYAWPGHARARDGGGAARHGARAGSILISGGTGSGKTTFSTACPRSSRTRAHRQPSRTRPELQLQQPTCAGWRPAANIEGAARSRSATWCATACACAPTASSSARCAGESLDMLQP